MGKYIYKAKQRTGKVLEGEIEAVSQNDVVDKLNELGLVPIKVVEKNTSAKDSLGITSGDREHSPRKKISFQNFSSGKIKKQDVYTFISQLSSLVKANVPMLKSLSLISQQTENRGLKEVVSELEKEVRNGKMLSEAMVKYPKLFSGLYLGMIKSGEKGGDLGEILQRLAQHQEKEQEIARRIQAALAYPLFMIVVGVGTIFVMFTFFIPRLTGLFENMGQKLPLLTQVLISTSKFMSHRWYYFLFLIFLFVIIFRRFLPGDKKKFLFDVIKLRLPFVRKFIKDSEMAKFSRTLSILLKKGIPIHESLELAVDTLDNDAVKNVLLLSVKQIVNEGITLSESLRRTQIMPPFIINMIAVGEEGGGIDSSLDEIANVYEKEVTQRLKVMASLLEPLLILVVGAFVGLIVFAMLLPIFNMGMK